MQVNLSLEWESKSFSELVDIIGGGTPKTSVEEYWNGNIPWISIKDFNNGQKYVLTTEKTITELGLNNSSTKILEKEDIIISARGTVGEVAMIKYEMAFNQSCYGLRAHNFLDKEFVYYLLKYNINKLKNNVHGSVFDTITTNTFDNIIVNVPPYEYQEKISYLLSNIDKLIEVKIHENINLRNLIKILYKNYFESFELDNIPDNWEMVNIESIINIYNGYSYKGNELQESDCAMVTIKNFNRNGSFRTDGFKEIVYSSKIKNYHFINENDVLISCTDVTQDADIIGNCIILLDKQNYNELIMSMDLVKIESKLPEINNFLLATIFKSYNFKKHILGYVNGTTVLHLDKKGIKKFEIALPKNLSELKNISERFEIIYDEIRCNQKEINKLVNLRDTLLPKLMSGEIDVSKIDI